MKNRPRPHAVHATRISVAGLIALDVPDVDEVREAPIEDNDVERTVYVLRAYVLLAKRSDDDCDIHLEVADVPNPRAPRVIVEIPYSMRPVQNDTIAALGLDDLPFSGVAFTSQTAVRLQMVGWGFYDLSHRSLENRKAGESHGSFRVSRKHGTKIRNYRVRTILELHPVFRVER
jgi:hypothetical protein